MEMLVIAALCVGLWTGVDGRCEVASTCVADITQDDCQAGEYLIQNLAIFGCCPGCETRVGLGEICINAQCAPGLVCMGVLCIQDTNVIPEEDGPLCTPPISGIYPNCLPDGRYGPVQCKGDEFIGRCFCTDANGKRIFGQRWRDEAQDMTCACSRHRAELEASGRTDVTIHCTPHGDYEPLQCDAGLCWCAEPRTGQPVSLVLPEVDMSLLPCYSAAVMGSQYLRQCESVVYAIGLIQKEQSEHGTNFLGNPVTFCDYDGSFGAFQVTNGQAYCTGRTSNILGAWQATYNSATSDMNCNCASDSMVHFPARGMAVSQVCLANGNYRPYQSAGSLHYCVDSDGYPTTDYMEQQPADNCGAYG